MKKIEIVIKKFALIKFDNKNRKYINYEQMAQLKTKIKTIKDKIDV